MPDEHNATKVEEPTQGVKHMKRFLIIVTGLATVATLGAGFSSSTSDVLHVTVTVY
jgi:hypothetical protein